MEEKDKWFLPPMISQTYKEAPSDVIAGVPGDDEEEKDKDEEEEEWSGFSKRKIISNWDRYKDSEKEPEPETRRGVEFGVLLTSAGDSFSQFRFAEEKEWDSDPLLLKQLAPAVFMNCEALAEALQLLPVALRLNVAADLVQEATPQELPQAKSVGHSPGPPQGQPKAPCPSRGQPKAPCPPLAPPADCLDEELDVLLQLEAPVTTEATPAPAAPAPSATHEDNEDDAPAAPVESEPPVAPPTNIISEEELEDWLDSMIA
ncbi:cell death regulator Aven [Tachyglossus aculeatus]|uniref:cell death regulator Aven n=1 Tax=Tachyglossus aculeatus TaxID=9261 RepID=UPI0018F6B8D7|nr:cell death regulator Aven [Tachyglossus aculeatus]